MKTRASASAAVAAVLLSVGLTAAAVTATTTATAAEVDTEAAAAADVEAVTSLRLTVTHGATPVAGTPRLATLECPPGSATTHPDPVTACRLVDAVDGDLDRLDVDPGICTAEYDPYTVTASGTYRGRPLSFRRTYGNRCTLAHTTGAVFAF
ncbi:SSI family serine proteinase inhibitor [Streptomyces sp. BE20]|uniref:SSI family serine proteinase inhibitor n=1 Tax=Streptomyces sp. BE20 TaxID=3002525 RepID=UPI002E7859B9|nr:SSI family serine proteinase inhibitor [Streptomyces sp. BE20]MEE1822269.1 SSI family serine proteinase inhibitor [Streptomyces sp. BE20]